MDHGTLRKEFSDELDDLRLQVEVMAGLVEGNLGRMATVLRSGDARAAEAAVADEAKVDEMLASLTEKCYRLLALQTPVASDLRLVVSVLRVMAAIERCGGLSLRVIEVGRNQRMLQANPAVREALLSMTGIAIDGYRAAMAAWSSGDVALASALDQGDDAMDADADRLTAALIDLGGPDRVEVALEASAAGRALERIAVHNAVIATRVRYLVTGDAAFLIREVPHGH